MSRGRLVAFLGPSLDAAVARRVAPGARLRPPARQGDVWRSLERDRPLAIALVDGVFEAAPPVWHRELLDALALGVAVFGGASMGALRAAELAPFGMVGVGRIAAEYLGGARLDDADVALLHADASAGFRPLTLAQVDAEAGLAWARARGLLRGREAAALGAAARALHYTRRTWPAVLALAGVPPERRGALLGVLRAAPSQKALDARACLEAAWGFARAGAPAPVLDVPRASAFVRRCRAEALGRPPGADAAGAVARGLVLGLGLAPSRRAGPPGLRAALAAERAGLDAWVARLGPRLVPDAGVDGG